MPHPRRAYARANAERAYRISAVFAAAIAASLTAGCRQCGSDSTAPEATRTTLQEAPATSAAEAPTPANDARTVRAPSGGWPNARSSLATNVTGVADWNTEFQFIDVFRMSREFTGGSKTAWADGRKLDVDQHGWLRSLAPDQEARTVMFNGSQFRGGKYVMLYEGKGEYRIGGSARLDSAASRPGRDVIDLDRKRGDTGITLDFTSVDKSDPIRNIRLIPPGGACEVDRARFCDAESPCPSGKCLEFIDHHEELIFHPDFLARTQQYGMVRYMTMMLTNDSPVVRWDQRGLLGNQTWATDGGVPVEVLARLTNQLHVEPWFCVPHQADDEYVRKLAQQLKELIDPSLPIWIEYSNEVWNGMFQQHLYAAQRARELGYPDNFQGVLRFYAKRSLEVFKIFEEVLGKDRVKTVLGSQAVNTWVSNEVLSFPGMAGHVDALAIAPYFGWNVTPEELPKLHKMSVDDLVAHTRDTLIPTTKKWLEDQSALTKQYKVEMVAYEAGQHFIGTMGTEEDAKLNKLFDDLNRDPRMKDLYLTYLENWRASGGTWLAHFVNCDVWSKWGRWGALETIRQPREQSPKFDALMTFMEKHERWW